MDIARSSSMIVAVSVDSEIVTVVPLDKFALLILNVKVLSALLSLSSETGTETVWSREPAVIVPDPDVEV